MSEHNLMIIFTLVTATSMAGCGYVSGARSSVDLVRDAAQVNGAAPRDVIVPFEVDVSDVEKARVALHAARTRLKMAKRLIESLSEARHFGVVYSEWTSLSAREAIDQRKGNCFSFASMLVGLSRAIGLRAVYAEFSSELDAFQEWEELTLRTGHITALVAVGGGEYLSMEIGRPVRYGRWRVITDREATAHYYNNRAFERLVAARARNEALPWAESIDDLRMATVVEPTFYRAWNNLGVAMVKLERPNEAIQYYRRAIEHQPKSGAARANLGRLYLDIGRPKEAETALSMAASIDDENAGVFYLLGLARWQTGRPTPAVEALERALELDEQHQEARTLMATIEESASSAND